MMEKNNVNIKKSRMKKLQKKRISQENKTFIISTHGCNYCFKFRFCVFFANLTKYTQIQEGQVNVGDELLRRTVVVVTSYCHTKNLEDKIKK